MCPQEELIKSHAAAEQERARDAEIAARRAAKRIKSAQVAAEKRQRRLEHQINTDATAAKSSKASRRVAASDGEVASGVAAACDAKSGKASRGTRSTNQERAARLSTGAAEAGAFAGVAHGHSKHVASRCRCAYKGFPCYVRAWNRFGEEERAMQGEAVGDDERELCEYVNPACEEAFLQHRRDFLALKQKVRGARVFAELKPHYLPSAEKSSSCATQKFYINNVQVGPDQ